MDNLIGLAEAKDQLSSLTARANATGVPFIITKNRKPWVEVRPLATPQRDGAITISPLKREITIASLDELFEGYDGDFTPREDGFSRAVGAEEL